MFESEEEEDPEIKKQIEAALDETGLLGDLMLSGTRTSPSPRVPMSMTMMMIWTRPSGITRIRRRGLGSPGQNRAVPKL